MTGFLGLSFLAFGMFVSREGVAGYPREPVP
ncbi:hypothetical protein OPIT5_13270 [Opitutaceae bacterium TAV5]|nr:hypothetical protein OPIT5_13270 [Opitutaceae bacterium TAV5]